MKVTRNIDHTISSFCEDLLTYRTSAFESGEEFKVFCLTSSAQDISTFLPQETITGHLGAITEVKIPYLDKQQRESVGEFYIAKYTDGLFFVFTASTKDAYVRTMERILKSRRGISPMWIPPKLFDKIKIHILKKSEESGITFFSARRSVDEQVPSKIRPEQERTISYWGIDGKESLEEMKYYYGVVPQIIEYALDYSSKLVVSNDGVFTLLPYQYDTIKLFIEVIELIVGDIIKLKGTVEKIKLDYKELKTAQKTLNVPSVEAGEIELSQQVLFSKSDVEKMVATIGEYQFSLCDVGIVEGSLSFRASVYDNLKEGGVNFNLSGTETSITLLPKGKETYESFLRFYRYIAENVDPNATISLFSERDSNA